MEDEDEADFFQKTSIRTNMKKKRKVKREKNGDFKKLLKSISEENDHDNNGNFLVNISLFSLSIF